LADADAERVPEFHKYNILLFIGPPQGEEGIKEPQEEEGIKGQRTDVFVVQRTRRFYGSLYPLPAFASDQCTRKTTYSTVPVQRKVPDQRTRSFHGSVYPRKSY
jgi:hypothetical protein